MQNGYDLVYAGIYGRAIVKWPGQDGLYYIFTAEHPVYVYRLLLFIGRHEIRKRIRCLDTERSTG